MEREKNGENLQKKGEKRLYRFSLQAEQGVNNQENNVKGRKAKKIDRKRRKALLSVFSAGRAGCNSLECLSNPPQPQINYN